MDPVQNAASVHKSLPVTSAKPTLVEAPKNFADAITAHEAAKAPSSRSVRARLQRVSRCPGEKPTVGQPNKRPPQRSRFISTHREEGTNYQRSPSNHAWLTHSQPKGCKLEDQETMCMILTYICVSLSLSLRCLVQAYPPKASPGGFGGSCGPNFNQATKQPSKNASKRAGHTKQSQPKQSKTPSPPSKQRTARQSNVFEQASTRATNRFGGSSVRLLSSWV